MVLENFEHVFFYGTENNTHVSSIVPAQFSTLWGSPWHIHFPFQLIAILFFSFYRSEIPYVFEVPTTLDALHDMISNYATTGKDVSLIIQRIHKANSVRLDKRNTEKMQNFYDVLIRRFVAVGDAIHHSGDGGEELGRYAQLDVLTQTLYAMAQESPESAGAVWSRRLGIFQNAHAKRLRDAVLERDDADEEAFSAWPSTGVVLALRAIGHIFPVTDKRHHVVTPAVLFLGQLISHTPILSIRDLIMGTMCCGLLIEYTKEAKRIAPEAHAFLASVIRLFARDPAQRCSRTFPLVTLGAAAANSETLATLRTAVSECKVGDLAPQLSLEADAIARDDMPAAILYSAMHLVETCCEKSHWVCFVRGKGSIRRNHRQYPCSQTKKQVEYLST